MAKSKPQPLIRFAALVRVSTEKQATKGESLRTQRTHAKDDIAKLGGRIVEWYGGQEHATPGYERKEMDRLLTDASKGKFDAIWVDNLDRWSRDNAKSKQGIEQLRCNRIRFFGRGKEYDLFDPTSRFVLGMAAEIGELLAGTQNQKSMENRIERAKRGIPTVGKLPFGRLYDEKSGKWEVDIEKKRMMEDIAKRYLSGEQLPKLANEYGVNHANLHKNLMHRCGTEWKMKWKQKDFNIDEEVTIKVPPLLSERTIKAVRLQAAANKTYQRSQPKHKYLLGRLVFCEHCGCAMSGQTNHPNKATATKRYFRHLHKSRTRPCTCENKSWVDATLLEENVIRLLLEMVGSPVHVKKAIEAAIPNKSKIDAMRIEAKEIESKLGQLKRKKNRLVEAFSDGALSRSDMADTIAKFAEQEEHHSVRLRAIQDQLEKVLDDDQIGETAQYTSGKLVALKDSANNYHAMNWDEKRALVELVFGGFTPTGKRCGIYIHWHRKTGDGTPNWKFAIQGVINKERLDPLPLDTLSIKYDDPVRLESKRGGRQYANR